MRDGWTTATLGEIATFENGYPFKPDELDEDGLPVIRIKQLRDPDAKLDHSTAVVPDKNRIDSGDLVFSWSGTLHVEKWKRGPALLNQHLFRVTPKPKIELEWLALALEAAVPELEGMTHGSTMKHITKKKLLAHSVAVPPLVVQWRIVDLIDHIDGAVTAAEQTVGATSGAGVRLRERTLNLSERRVPLASFAEVRMGRQRSPRHHEGDHMVPYLRSANVKDNRLDLSDVKRMNFTPGEQEMFEVRAGDVLVTEGSGSLREVGASAMWAAEIPAPVAFQNTLLRLRTRDTAVSRQRYLLEVSRWAYESGLWLDVASGTNIKHIGARRAERALVPLLDVPEQDQLCAMAEAIDITTRIATEWLSQLRLLRGRLLQSLLSGNHEVPESYDRFLEKQGAA